MEDEPQTFLRGVRVLELADELGEYCGRRLVALGADVIKIEPPGGELTRTYGPFVDDIPDPEGSLYFWHYNAGKRSVVCDLDTAEGQQTLRALAKRCDVLIDTRPAAYLDDRGVGSAALRAENPRLIYARITPFGEDGPWAEFTGSDLVHLALGGVMMNCGYDPDTAGAYDTPPIAPQMWQAYHVGGEMAALGILGALASRQETGEGQHLSTAIHQAVSGNSEVDLPAWIYNRLPHHRQTCRHSGPALREPVIKLTKDGRWVLPYITYLADGFNALASTIRLLKRHGMEMDLEAPEYSDPEFFGKPATRMHITAALAACIARLKFSANIWKEAQDEGMPWAPLRRPEENLTEEHWAQRQTFADLAPSGFGRAATDVVTTWRTADVPVPKIGPAPRLGAHTADVIAEVSAEATSEGHSPSPTPGVPAHGRGVRPRSVHGAEFALSGVRVVDLSWMLASGGAARFLSALGAEVIKVEHASRPDGYRSGSLAPNGGRAERERATGPITPRRSGPNQSGAFMEVAAGRRSVSLNLKHEQGRALLTELIAGADMVIEGFSPGTMERMGLGYARLQEIRPGIIYVAQSGMGEVGTLGRIRMFGPSAQAISGLSEMSGLPEPYPPAGIGYSYLDWFGAYNMAAAMLAALYRKRATGLGCHIDASQAELGLWLSGTALLDASVNGRRWSRYGNRSPYKPAAPHGAFRTEGDDRWIAIACFTDAQWRALVGTLGEPEWAAQERFATLAGRIAHQDALETLVDQATAHFDPFKLMEELQSAGVPAGVCQTAEDRFETDPQLKHLEWMVDLPQSEIGTWPVREFPVRFSATPAYMGGPIGRGAPNYGEDNAYVLGELLGRTPEEIAQLAEDGVS
jgi:crotonobetainyl-CoA:carnitine CoA-transferase CaiB-like acyl-CoA transferase